MDRKSGEKFCDKKKFLRELCLQNQIIMFCKMITRLNANLSEIKIKQKLRHFYQNKIEKEAANSKRKFFNLLNGTSGKTLTTHHNKQIVENIETFNTFFANIGVELAKAFDSKQKYEIETNTNTMFCFPITSSEIVDTLRVLPSKFSLDYLKINYFFLKKYLGQLVHYLKHYIMNVQNLAYFHSA